MASISVPAVHFETTLSDGSVHYEKNKISAWRELRDYCIEHGLTVSKMTVYSQDGEAHQIKRNNQCYFFVFYDVAASLRTGKQTMRKCYGVTARHPKGVTKTYCTWFSDDGHFLQNEVKRGAEPFYESEIGIKATKMGTS
jgi:hypothetical protein